MFILGRVNLCACVEAKRQKRCGDARCNAGSLRRYFLRSLKEVLMRLEHRYVY